MFHSSTQRQHWMFKSEGELQEKRRSVNGSFCEKQEKDKRMLLLDPTEELQLLHYYQKKLVEICSLFAPPHWAPLPRTALVSGYHFNGRSKMIMVKVCGLLLYFFIAGDSSHVFKEVLP